VFGVRPRRMALPQVSRAEAPGAVFSALLLCCQASPGEGNGLFQPTPDRARVRKMPVVRGHCLHRPEGPVCGVEAAEQPAAQPASQGVKDEL